MPAYDPLDDMMEFENGTLDEDGIRRLFQHLVDTGMAWSLQGFYGRAAHEMLRAGIIEPRHGRGEE